MLIEDADLKKPYRILGIDLPKESLKHLSNLGVQVGENLEIVTKTKNSAIIVVKGSRLAFDGSILEKIDITPADEEQESLPLSELPVGSFAIVNDIFAVNEAKRRLMDMGITKRTKLYLRKVAPLGDPIEINLRGYELTLRKSEAQMISVIHLDKEEKA
ncbi:ferrous iron transport protein A [Streptococcus dentiloxodontae]